MASPETSIKDRIRRVILRTCLAVLMLTSGAFIAYELAASKKELERTVQVIGQIIAANSAAYLIYQGEDDARDMLASLATARQIRSAVLYTDNGRIFATFPANGPASLFPSKPPRDGIQMGARGLTWAGPVFQGEHRVGTLYLRSSLAPLYKRLWLYTFLGMFVLAGSLLLAFALSNSLQRSISRPILDLADTARLISEGHNPTLRAVKRTRDEVGVLTDAFNQMLNQVQKAEESQALLAAIVASSDDAIIGKDLHGTIISWNRGAERMFGYTAEEVVGQPVTRLTAPDRPDEEDRILERMRKGSRVEHYETVRFTKEGQPRHVSLSVSPIRNAQGEIVGVSSIARDITEHKRAEAALAHQASALREQAQLLDLANVLARDLEDRIILWTAGMEQMYGWRREEAMGKVSHDLLHTRFPQPSEELRATLLAQGEWAGELIHHRRDGEELIVASHWVLHRDDQARPVAILEVNNDISERKRAEGEIRRLNAELEDRVRKRTAELTEANRELEAFTYSVSHDLRAPLRHIDAFARILEEGATEQTNPETRNYLQRIRRGTQMMGRLVDDLLNLSRVGRATLKSEPVDLDEVVQNVIADLSGEVASRQIDWRVNELPTIKGDPGLLEQVFTNLISNAIKYTRPRPVAVIEVGTQILRDKTVIYVRDNGVGFNMKYVGKLFGVFERLHRAEDFEGTGIGLATVRRIVSRHGGEIWAEGAVDQGATFYLTLPEVVNEALLKSSAPIGSAAQQV